MLSGLRSWICSGGEFMKRIVVLAFFTVVALHPLRTHAAQVQADEINSLRTAAHRGGVLNGTVIGAPGLALPR